MKIAQHAVNKMQTFGMLFGIMDFLAVLRRPSVSQQMSALCYAEGVRFVPTLFSLAFLGCSILHPETLTVTPAMVTMRQAQGGPLAAGKKISIAAVGEPVEWTASASTDDGQCWIYLEANNGK